MRAKAIVMAVLATLAIASSASAAVPSGYDEYVIVPKKVVDWRQFNYDEGVYIPRVTRLEARHGGYEDNVPVRIIIKGE